MDKFLALLRLIVILVFVFTLVGWRSNWGPVIWLRKARGKTQAQNDDSSRRELIERVRQLLPQATNNNVVFSLQVETKTRGGGRTRVTTYTYYYKVFVADSDCLWIVPFSYDKKTKDYQLGQPVALTQDLIQHVDLSGKRGKKLEVSFRLKPEVGLDKVVMVLEPLCFKLNKFYPFNFLQEEACGKAMELTERLAMAACGQSAEDLEKTRVEDECTTYATIAGVLGFCGIIAASVSHSIPLTLAIFAAALAMFGVMISKKQFPKISLVFVIVEAVIASLLIRL